MGLHKLLSHVVIGIMPMLGVESSLSLELDPNLQ
jgi:hypothetical protein